MDSKLIELVCRQIARQYPEFAGVHPKTSNLPNQALLLVFHTVQKTADGKAISRELRVTVDAKGRILKTSTSR